VVVGDRVGQRKPLATEADTTARASECVRVRVGTVLWVWVCACVCGGGGGGREAKF
jgi:hypothetical protein